MSASPFQNLKIASKLKFLNRTFKTTFSHEKMRRATGALWGNKNIKGSERDTHKRRRSTHRDAECVAAEGRSPSRERGPSRSRVPFLSEGEQLTIPSVEGSACGPANLYHRWAGA